MNWNTSNRRKQLPKNWQQLRKQTARRAGYQCQATQPNGTQCPHPGTDCDHITPGNNHHPTNLQWLCKWHHQQKTHHEAQQAKQKHKTKPPTHPHPGLKQPPPPGATPTPHQQ